MFDQHEVTAMGDTFSTFVNTSTSEPPVAALTQEMLDNYIREVTMATGRRNLTNPVHFHSDFSSPDADWPSFDTEQYNYVYQDREWTLISEPEPAPRDTTLRDMYPPRREPEGPGIESISMIGFK